MNQAIYCLGIATSITLSCLATLSPVRAQIVPDTTLPLNSTVTLVGTVFAIEGGTVQGTNLFHSFQSFSVPTGGGAFFNNGLGIQNIFSRVTGNLTSNIDGSIGANGTANLFFLNPNGIIFGQNATLNIGGSFFASTASSLLFNDGTIFSAKPATQTNPLLTISVPIGLQYGNNPGNVQVQGAILEVKLGKTLALVGGNLSIQGGQLLAPGGRVELGGLAGEGIVGLVANGSELSLSFPVGVVRGDVSLSNGAQVNVRAGGDGSIGVNAFNLRMTQESQLLAGIAEDSGSVDTKAGNIEINATGVMDLTDQSDIINDVRPRAKGQGGDVNITTSHLHVSGGSQVSASTLGQGNGGNLTVNASKDVQVIGTSADGQFIPSGLFATTTQGASGKAGDLTINTGTLLVRDGADVSSRTLSPGNGGNLTVNASKDVQVIGRSANDRFSGGLSTSTTRDASGKAGDLTINTGTLLVRDGAQVGAGTFGQGDGGNLSVNASQQVQVIGRSADDRLSSGLFTQANPGSSGKAGDLTINTDTLLVRDGAVVSASTFGQGNGGKLTVNASQQVQVIGFGRSADGRVFSGLSTQANSDAAGKAGDLTINTDTLLVRDGAVVSVLSFQGQAGNMTIQANSLLLNRGRLFAETAKSDEQGGANITLYGLDLLRMDNESRISANALDQADGGNITIKSTFVIATPPTGSKGSDITADAKEGNGGTVRITTQGLFGIQFRPNLTPKNDITVSTESPSSLPGTFQLITPDVDPTRGLTNLPTEIVETSKQIAQTCASGGATARGENKFMITGRGGLPQSPNEVLTPDMVQDDLGTLTTGGKDAETQGRGDAGNSPTTHSAWYSQSSIGNPPRQLVEAQGWIISPNGKVILTAQASDATPHSTWQTPANCQVSQRAS